MSGASGNQFTPRDAAALRRISAVYHQFAPLMVSMDWEPYAYTVQPGVFSSKFPGADSTLWTIVNRNEYDLAGDELVVPHREGRHYYDVWNGTELQPRIRNNQATLALPIEPRGFGAVLAVEKGATVAGLPAFLERMKELNKVPLQSLSNVWHSLPQQIAPIAPTKPAATAPAGMVTVPGGDYDFHVSASRSRVTRGRASTSNVPGKSRRGAATSSA